MAIFHNAAGLYLPEHLSALGWRRWRRQALKRVATSVWWRGLVIAVVVTLLLSGVAAGAFTSTISPGLAEALSTATLPQVTGVAGTPAVDATFSYTGSSQNWVPRCCVWVDLPAR